MSEAEMLAAGVSAEAEFYQHLQSRGWALHPATGEMVVLASAPDSINSTLTPEELADLFRS